MCKEGNKKKEKKLPKPTEAEDVTKSLNPEPMAKKELPKPTEAEFITNISDVTNKKEISKKKFVDE